MIDDCENVTAPGLCYIEGRFMEKVDVLAKGFLHKLSNRKHSFLMESVVYPFVQFKDHKEGFYPFHGKVC